MNTINNEKLETLNGFLYLNPYNPYTQWNIARGVFNSASVFHSHDGHQNLLSISMSEMLTNNFERLSCELEIERIRSINYPNCVSRLNGIFIFDSPEDALNVMENENWGYKELSKEDLTDIGACFRNSSRHDSNWFELIVDHNFKLTKNWIEYTHQYWKGEINPYKTAIWERIIDGTITVTQNRIREIAVEDMINTPAKFQNSLGLLTYAINAGRLGSHDGECAAFFTEKNTIEYFIKLHDIYSDDFIKKMKEYYKHNPKKLCKISYDKEWKTPNLDKMKVDQENLNSLSRRLE